MFNALQAPGCSRFGMTDSYVPFEPNVNADGTPNPRPARTTRSSTARSSPTRAGSRSGRSST